MASSGFTVKICPGGRADGSPLRVSSRLKLPQKAMRIWTDLHRRDACATKKLQTPKSYRVSTLPSKIGTQELLRPAAATEWAGAFGSRRLIQVVLILRDIFRPISGSRRPRRRPGLKILAEIGLQDESGRRRQGALGREPARGRRFNGQVLVTPRGPAAGQLPAGIPEVIGCRS